MQRLWKIIGKNTQSTARVDAMPDGAARAALERRLAQLLQKQAEQFVPVKRSFAPLVNPLEK